MGMKKMTVRVNKDVLQKLTAVAKCEGRSVNSQIVQLLRKDVEEFEKRHGEIPLPEEITDGQ